MAFNILIVDDSAIMRSIIGRTIKVAGVPVGDMLQAVNGREGLEALRRNWVDLVFADINMPVMDGMAMIEEMAGDDLLAKVPVIVVSTEGSETKIAKLRHMGVMKAFIKKPFTPEEIRDIARELLGDWDEGIGIRRDTVRDVAEDF